MEETENTPLEPIEPTETEVQTEFTENKILAFVKKRFVVLALIVAVIVVYLWGQYKIKAIERKYTEQTGHMLNMDNMRIDSMSLANTQLTTKVFGWAVRGELLRGNIEQMDIFFNAFIKEQKIERIDLIHPETHKIIRSTNKKMEDTNVSDAEIISVEKQFVKSYDSSSYMIISPVMGLDAKIGILAVTIKK